MTTTTLANSASAYQLLLNEVASYVGDTFDEKYFHEYIQGLNENDPARQAYDQLDGDIGGITWTVTAEITTDEFGRMTAEG